MISKLLPKTPMKYWLISPAYYAVFGLIFFYIIYNQYNAEILYFKLQPFFAFDSAYFDYYKNLHNGLLIVLSQFFLQFLSLPVLGTLLLVGLLLFQSFLLYRLLNLTKYYFIKGVEFIPSILLLISLKNYSLGIETLMLNIVVLSFLALGLTLPKKVYILRIIYQLATVSLVFLTFGILTAFSLAILIMVSEFYQCRSKYKLATPLFLIGLLFILIKIKLGFTLLHSIFDTVNPENIRLIMPQYWILLIVTSSLLILPFILNTVKSYIDRIKKIPAFFIHSYLVILTLVFVLLFGKSLIFNPDKHSSAIEFYAYTKAWKKALRYKNEVSINDRISIFQLNRALYHTGAMSKQLFSIPQVWGKHSLFLTMKFTRECTINSSDLFFDMGFIKGSQYWALEAQTYNPYSPRVLKRLASCSVLLNNLSVAQKYLTILSNSWVECKWAESVLNSIDKQQTDELKTSWVGNYDIEHDILFLNNEKPNLDLIQLLEKDPDNHMAFEYLMTYYILTAETGNFLHFFDKFGNSRSNQLPALYQQLLVTHQLFQEIPDEEFGFTIDSKVKNQLVQFNTILIEHKLNAKSAQKDLYRLFGDTYWYYLRYHNSAVTGGSIKKKSL